MLIQQHIWPNAERGRIGYGWDVVLVENPSQLIFRVLDYTTIFKYLNDVAVISWITPVSKVVDIGQEADLDVKIT